MNLSDRFLPEKQVALVDAFRSTRAFTVNLIASLSAEDCAAQSMPQASPAKWHLAHTSWFFETFVLEAFEPDFAPFDAAFRVLFNSYYNAVGERYARPQRGLLTRPSLEQVLAYRAHVNQRIEALLAQPNSEVAALVELGIHHEQQHQELLLTDIKHLLSRNPTAPVFLAAGDEIRKNVGRAPRDSQWIPGAAGLVDIGHEGAGFAFDNETPRHRVYLEPYELSATLVTNAEFAAFIAAGGYDDPTLWLSEGWDWRVAEQRSHPLYWQRSGADWAEFTLHGLVPVRADHPVVHICYYEADAFARWSDARLPTEFEWEASARAATRLAPNTHHLHPQPRNQSGLAQLACEAWQWTSSSYAPYPGFRATPNAIGEYNGKFMVNQYVLRGGSCVTPAGHVRASYRNFFPAAADWQFSGIRLARSR